MKTRVLTAIALGLILIPVFIVGGNIFNIAVLILSWLGLREFLKAKESKKDIPVLIDFISYIILTFIVLSGFNKTNIMFTIDFRVIAALFLIFLIPTIFYHDSKKYSISDAFYLIGGVFFLGTSFELLIIYRNINYLVLIYLFLIPMITDTYAYIVGSLIGKHHLLESISPNKTIEGTIAGTVFGTFIGTVYYLVFVDASANMFLIILMTLFLSVIGQFGDLVFSNIKRYFDKKDFSNILPGHGGILDRFDSLLFVVLSYLFFL